jgi:hypothetical protein
MSPQYAYASAPDNSPFMMAGGGLTSSARALQGKGRNGDSMLVHMTPGEVGGLQALARAGGGSLTVNPHTGLPEANFLKSLLPTLVGVGLSFIPGVGPLMAGGLVGGFETLRTGDLGKGIMAGLGAYGGAGLGSALTTAGGASAMGAEAAKQTAAANASGTAAGALNPATTELAGKFGTQAGADAILAAGQPTTFAGNAAAAGQGFKSLAQPGGFSNFATGLDMAIPSTTGKIAAATPALMEVSNAFSPKLAVPGPDEGDSKYPYAGPYKAADRAVAYRPESDQSTSEFQFFSPSNPYPGFVNAASGGLMALKQYAAGGAPSGGLNTLPAASRYLQGAGDGTSDSIPAVIGTKQPARLADGEFVVDARTVSEIGNGSSNAGAKKLYAMMERVHSSRKKAKRGQDTKAERFLPA